jgi:hypothetical protein
MLYITHKFKTNYIILLLLIKKLLWFFSLYIMISTSIQLYYLNISRQKYNLK